jgi:hypothetical protein
MTTIRRMNKGIAATTMHEPTTVERTPQSTEREPMAKELADLKQFVARARATTGPRLKPSDEDRLDVVIDHADQDVGLALLMHAIGTTDLDFQHGLMSQLVALNDDHGEGDYHRANFMLSVIKGLKPRDQLEAMLGAQMAAVHVGAMVLARRLIASENIIHQDSTEGALNRLTRTFANQMECLKRYRASGPQTVQNVSVGEGGQAIIANVSQPPTDPMPPKDVAPAPPTGETNVVPLPAKRAARERLSVIPSRRKQK